MGNTICGTEATPNEIQTFADSLGLASDNKKLPKQATQGRVTQDALLKELDTRDAHGLPGQDGNIDLPATTSSYTDWSKFTGEYNRYCSSKPSSVFGGVTPATIPGTLLPDTAQQEVFQMFLSAYPTLRGQQESPRVISFGHAEDSEPRGMDRPDPPLNVYWVEMRIDVRDEAGNLRTDDYRADWDDQGEPYVHGYYNPITGDGPYQDVRMVNARTTAERPSRLDGMYGISTPKGIYYDNETKEAAKEFGTARITGQTLIPLSVMIPVEDAMRGQIEAKKIR